VSYGLVIFEARDTAPRTNLHELEEVFRLFSMSRELQKTKSRYCWVVFLVTGYLGHFCSGAIYSVYGFSRLPKLDLLPGYDRF
jgi:hypothetical protein